MNQPALTPERFDSVLVSKPEKIWGAPAIAKALGVSVDTVYRWSSRDDTPIHLRAGRYFALRSEIEIWLRSA